MVRNGVKLMRVRRKKGEKGKRRQKEERRRRKKEEQPGRWHRGLESRTNRESGADQSDRMRAADDFPAARVDADADAAAAAADSQASSSACRGRRVWTRAPAKHTVVEKASAELLLKSVGKASSMLSDATRRDAPALQQPLHAAATQ